MTRADHDRAVLEAFGFQRLSRAGDVDTYVLWCHGPDQARDVVRYLKRAELHVPRDQNRLGSRAVVVYVTDKEE